MRRATGVLIALAACASAASAADAAAGKAKAATACAVCHGPLGLGSMPDAPHIAGQPVVYLERQLKAFRSGERKHEIMGVIAKQLTDADIQNLAAWFSSVQLEAKHP